MTAPQNRAVPRQQKFPASFTFLFSSPAFAPPSPLFRLFLYDHRGETLGVLDVDGLNVAVQLLLGTLLVVSSAGNADADPVGNALDALLPNLLVELGVDTDVGGALGWMC